MHMYIILLTLIQHSLQFNIDTQSAYVLKNDNGLFGYSVALHRSSSDNLVLVGAPNADSNVDGVTEPGVIFKCRVDEDSLEPVECTDMVELFNDGGNKKFHGTTYSGITEDKSHQFLGVSLSSSDRYIAACAHRYEMRYGVTESRYQDDPPRQLLGRCLVASGDFEDLIVLKPCDNNRDSGYESYGNCQAGTSCAIADDSLVLGTPGKSKGVGGAYAKNVSDYSDAIFEMVDIAREEGIPEELFDKYIGYSSVVCDMDNNDASLEYIFGGPRGAMYRGEVHINMLDEIEKEDGNMETNLTAYWPEEGDPTYYFNLKGEQIGSYFGHSLACADLNGDGYDDLVVGAPWYTDYEAQRGTIPADTGRVYIYYGAEYWDLRESITTKSVQITGDQANAAFGFSLGAAGDTNGDTYGDMFVGSPYYNDGEGAVFLYLGSATGLQTDYSQMITPQSLNVMDGLKTFGWSISGGKDMDENGYPDVAIGAYKSKHVVFLRTIRIIDVTPKLHFNETTIYPDGTNLDIPESEKKSPVTDLMVCLEHTKDMSKAKNKLLDVTFKISLDVTTMHHRVSFDHAGRYWEETLQVDFSDSEVVCSGKKLIYLDEPVQDVRPISVTISAKLANDEDTFNDRVVLNQELFRNAATDLTIASKCEQTSGECKVDMEIDISKVTFPQENLYPEVVYGFVKSFTQIITVKNLAKPPYNYAYGVVVNMTVPKDLVYSSVTKLQPTGPRVVCADNAGVLVCDLPDTGPMNNEEIMSQSFGVVFSIENIIDPIDLTLKAQVSVTEPSIEQKEKNNIAENVIPIKSLANLIIRGGASQRNVQFNNKYTIVNKAVGSKNITVRHDYSVQLTSEDADGVENITLNIYWPQRASKTGPYILPLRNIVLPERLKDFVYCTPNIASIYSTPYQAVYEGLSDKEKNSVGVIGDGYVLEDPEEVSSDDIPPAIDCSKDKSSCLKIQCNIEQINRGAAHLHGFKISLIAQVHEANLHNNPGINVTSYAEIISVQDGLVIPLLRSATGRTELSPSPKSYNFLWIIIVSVIGGLLFLVFLVLVLWKVGFFKRKQPPTIKADKVTDNENATF